MPPVSISSASSTQPPSRHVACCATARDRSCLVQERLLTHVIQWFETGQTAPRKNFHSKLFPHDQHHRTNIALATSHLPNTRFFPFPFPFPAAPVAADTAPKPTDACRGVVTLPANPEFVVVEFKIFRPTTTSPPPPPPPPPCRPALASLTESSSCRLPGVPTAWPRRFPLGGTNLAVPPLLP